MNKTIQELAEEAVAQLEIKSSFSVAVNEGKPLAHKERVAIIARVFEGYIKSIGSKGGSRNTPAQQAVRTRARKAGAEARRVNDEFADQPISSALKSYRRKQKKLRETENNT